ncbi:MAG: sodium:solute symporter family transporter [Hyphomicrobiaceae bacterium]
MTTVLIGVLLYVAVQFAVGVWVSRSVKSVSDFIVGGRSLGIVLVTFSVYATFFGAEAIVGTGGAVYQHGLNGAATDPFGYGIAILIVALVFAWALWAKGHLTFADVFRDRYSPTVERLVVLALLPGSIFWAAAQIRAFGQVVTTISDVPLLGAMAICALVVVGYSAFGGLLADAWTDLVQGIAIVFGLMVLAIVLTLDQGGLFGALANVEADRLRWSPAADGWLPLLETLAVPICGTIVAVEIVSRVLAARSAAVAVRGTALGGLVYIAVGLIPVYIALVGASVLPGIEDPEQIIPKLAATRLPTLLYIAFVGAMISAMLSTVDTILLASSAQLSHNLLFRIFPVTNPGRELLLTRLTLVGLTLVAFLLAATATTIKELVETASAAGSSGVVVIAVFGLFTRFGGPRAAVAAMAVGIGGWVLLGRFSDWETPYITAVAASTLIYVVVAFGEATTTKKV